MSTVPLKKALSILKPIAGPADKPVLLIAHPDGVHLVAEDADHRIAVTVPGSVDGGKWTLPPRCVLPHSALSALATGARLDVDILPDAKIRAGGVVALRCSDDAAPEGAGAIQYRREVLGEDAAAVGAALVAVLPSVSADGCRVGLNGAEWGRRAVVATDGKRLMAASVPETVGPTNRHVIARETIRLLDRLPVPTSISEGETVIDVRGDGYHLRGRLTEGAFPDWSMVVPKAWQHRARVPGLGAHAADAAKAIRGMDCGKKPSVRVVVNGAWESRVDAVDGGTWSAAVDCQHEGPDDGSGGVQPLRIGLNARFLADACVFVGGGVEVEFGDALSPVLLAGTAPGRLAIIMPMRLD